MTILWIYLAGLVLAYLIWGASIFFRDMGMTAPVEDDDWARELVSVIAWPAYLLMFLVVCFGAAPILYCFQRSKMGKSAYQPRREPKVVKVEVAKPSQTD